jgi:hypothetical protein
VQLLDELAMGEEAAALEASLDLAAGIGPEVMLGAWQELALQQLGEALQPSQGGGPGSPPSCAAPCRLEMLPASRPASASTPGAKAAKPPAAAPAAAPAKEAVAGRQAAAAAAAAAAEDLAALRALVAEVGVAPASSAATGQPLSSCGSAGLEGQLLLRPRALHQAWARTARFLLARGCHEEAGRLLTPALECAGASQDDPARAECLLLLAAAHLQGGRPGQCVAALEGAQAAGCLAAAQWRGSVLLYCRARGLGGADEGAGAWRECRAALQAGAALLGTLAE